MNQETLHRLIKDFKVTILSVWVTALSRRCHLQRTIMASLNEKIWLHTVHSIHR